jgi:hypothetical protein
LLTVFAQISRAQYNPGNDSRVIFWLDANDSSTLYQDQNQTPADDDGEVVGVWMDKSANGWHVSNPADVSFPGLDDDWKPILKLNHQNGKPAVRFEVHSLDPAEWDFLKTTAASLQGNSYTFFVVARRLAPEHQEGLLSLWSSDQEGNNSWDSIRPGGARVGHTSRESSPFVLGDARDDTILSRHDYLDNYFATLLYCSKYNGANNVAYLNGAAATAVNFTSAFSSERIQLGAMSDFQVYPPSSYDYFEVLIYNTALNDADRVAVEGYLNGKWAISGGPSGVSVTASANNTREAYDTPVQVNVVRPDTSGDLTANVALGGTATFGVDYVAYPWDGSGTVTIPDGANSVSFGLYLIPDSRAEGGETVTVTIQSGSYTVLAPSSQTITITDDDSNAMPANGWQLIDLGTGVYGNSAYGMGINTVDGGGGRGIAVGYQSGYYGNGQIGPAFKWNNGSSSVLFWNAAWNSFPTKWAAALAINNAGTIVGHSGHYPHNAPGGYAGYYQRPSFWRATDTYATELSVISGSESLYPLNNVAIDINQRVGNTGGVIVGNSRRANNKDHAVYWQPDANGNYGAAQDLFDIADGTKNSYAGAINNNGVVVGKSQISGANNYHAFRSQAINQLPQPLFGPTDDMGTATGNDAHTSEGNDINDLGEMVGASHVELPGQYQYRAVYKAPGTGKNAGYYDLGVLGEGTADAGNSSVANAISANGLIVGKSKLKVNGAMVDRAFVVSNVGNPDSQPMLNLTEQASVYVHIGGGVWEWRPISQYGYVITSAERINPAGWIVGYGTFAGQTRAFVLAPR